MSRTGVSDQTRNGKLCDASVPQILQEALAASQLLQGEPGFGGGV